MSFNLSSQNITITDSNFEQALIDLGWDTNGLNGNILVSEAEAIDSLDIQDPIDNTLLPNVTAKIKTLEGIEAMVNLVSLEAGGNELTSVDLSKNINLKNLFLNDNQLTNIDVSKNLALERFGVMRNQIASIDISMLVNLVDLFVHENQIASLDITNNTELNWLYATNNQLTSINLSKNTKLKRIDIYGNQLTSIDVSMLPDLEDFRIAYNQLTYLDVSANSNLRSFSCNGNLLTTLNVKNGNNVNFTYFSANNNSDLTCIQVDDASFSLTNWSLVDDIASFSTNCGISSIVYIPDYNMKTALVADTSINSNEDTEIQVSEAEAVTGTITLEGVNIDDLSGIEAFINITGLIVRGNNLTSVNLSNNDKISFLSIDNNQLTSLDIRSLTNLETIYAGNNQLSEIDVTNNLLLKKLWLNINNLSSLDISKNTFLEELELDWNYDLLEIDFSNNLNLNRIHLWKTAISKIDITQLIDLERLYVSETNLTSIDITKNTKLYDFRSTDNPQIPTYDFSNNTALIRIDLTNSNVNDVDVSKNVNLTQLLLGQNNLTSIDISKNIELQELYLNENSIVNIDITNNLSLTKLFLNDNLLERAYLKNENNTAIVEFNITNNPNLSCIAVDDVDFSTTNWTNIDAATNYKIDCNSDWEVYTVDSNLEDAINVITGIDANNDDLISYEEALSYTGDLDLSGQDITDITGLEAFINAASINLSNNNITDISSLLSGNTVLIYSKSTNEKRTAERASSNVKILNVSNNLLESVDISSITNITELYLSNNKLVSLNLKNGNNTVLDKLDVTSNPNLTCIQVDDVDAANSKTEWLKDTSANYSTDCSGTLAIDDYLKDNIVIYPNPATSFIEVSLVDGVALKNIEIYNLIGKKVLISDDNLIKLEKLSKGVYLIKVTTDKGLLTRKIIKE
ncbi:T9SS type A sorting domain-containing protein [Polaribacter sargassicola]|uniref:T9SS type A sorting domain-containing protein n=1 Tax=Polaribacter sargassicola TaxID=2836891 RepID=UPI001F228492|nr:T9SS type A sorting domain-containing protein [Polaribacter sp. DS7-9]MCG1036984.1 T9SS type A sorting domain-containing protein [Polaribacter sp. DS7-9]